MPKMKLTDRLIRSLKVDRQTDFWDEGFPGGSFGIRVTATGRKTFVTKPGKSIRLCFLSHEISLASSGGVPSQSQLELVC